MLHQTCVPETRCCCRMIFAAKNELQQYLVSINPLYARYTEALWANGVNSIAQLGNASMPAMHACGVKNPVHAGNIIAQSKAPGKWSSVSYNDKPTAVQTLCVQPLSSVCGGYLHPSGLITHSCTVLHGVEQSTCSLLSALCMAGPLHATLPCMRCDLVWHRSRKVPSKVCTLKCITYQSLYQTTDGHCRGRAVDAAGP